MNGADFWSRRKAGVAEEARQAAPEPAPDPTPEPLPDRDVLAALDLPDPDTLARGDNFAAFLAREVPAHLRRRALRRLWRSDPVLACVDGLNDYDWDFASPADEGAVRTAYRVGRGFLRQVAEPEAPPPEPEEAEPEVEPEAEQIEMARATPEADNFAPDAPHRPRRMRFSLPEAAT